MNIIPAIIPNSLNHLQESLAQVNFTKRIQIDVVDGLFVNNVSWPYSPKGQVTEIKESIEGFDVEVDLMVSDPLPEAKDWLAVGAKALVFHIEAVSNSAEIFDLRAEKSFALGMSLSNNTPIESIYPYLEQIDFLQIMGISEIGSQGQPFDIRALERVAMIHALYPNLIISVDGGISQENILNLKKAGATNFVIGSTIIKSEDPEETYNQLLKTISS